MRCSSNYALHGVVHLEGPTYLQAATPVPNWVKISMVVPLPWLCIYFHLGTLT